MKKEQQLINENISTRKTVLLLAWPAILEEVMRTMVSYVDTAMVGSMGVSAAGSVTINTTLLWLMNGIISGPATGFSVLTATAVGEGNREKVCRIMRQAVIAMLALGAAMLLLMEALVPFYARAMGAEADIIPDAKAYLTIIGFSIPFQILLAVSSGVVRGTGDTKTPMFYNVSFNLINIVLNFLLIYPSREISLFSHRVSVYGAGMGVEGAAIASAISYTVGGVLITAVLWRHPMVSPKGCSLRPDGRVLRPCLKVALPNMLQRFGTSLGYVVFASMINALGQTATAAHTIANTVESAFYIPGFGMQTAADTLSGNALGAGDNDRMKRLARTILPLEVGLMIVSGGLLFAFARPLMSLFSSDEQVIALGSTVLRMVAVSEPFYGVPIVIEGMMQGVGRTLAPFLFNLAGMWGVRIAGTFVCTRLLGLGLQAAWACMIAHNLLLCLLFSLHFRRGTWNPLNAKGAAASCSE